MNIKDALTGIKRAVDVTVDKTSHHYITLSQLNSWIQNVAGPFARGTLLDYGCGGQPYRAVFSPYINTYIGADVAAAAGVELDIELTPQQNIALNDGSVDTVLSTQTLEHIYDFQRYLNDCNRVLRPAGRLILTAPMQWRMHETPFDYWRFTRYGIEKAIIDSGFSLLNITPCGGVFSLVGQIFLNHLHENRGLNKPRLFSFLNSLFLHLDSRFSDTEDTLLWMCLAEKSH